MYAYEYTAIALLIINNDENITVHYRNPLAIDKPHTNNRTNRVIIGFRPIRGSNSNMTYRCTACQ